MATTTKKQLKKKVMRNSILLAIPALPKTQFIKARNLLVKQVRNRKDPKKILKFYLKDKKQKIILGAQETKKRDALIGVLKPEIKVSFLKRLSVSLFDLSFSDLPKLKKRVDANLELAVDHQITSRKKSKRWY